MIGSDHERNPAPPTFNRQGIGNLGLSNASLDDSNRRRSQDANPPPPAEARSGGNGAANKSRLHRVGETPAAGADDAILYERLIENTDRLRKLIAATNAALDRIVKPPSAKPWSAGFAAVPDHLKESMW